MNWLFLAAYTCSGLAGLIYEVSWTRWLTLYIGHTTAAASAVVAAFLGGLAAGAWGGGAIASRLTPRASLTAYVGLEIFVAIVAIVLPFELTALTPLLKWSYHNGDPGLLFPAVRLGVCLLLVFVPASALGATFPLAIRWFAHTSKTPARASGTLYAANTAGAAVGALLAGFALIPAIGISGTIRVGIAGSLAAAAGVWIVSRSAAADGLAAPQPETRSPRLPRKTKRGASAVAHAAKPEGPPVPPWLAPAVVGLSGFAALMHEIVWTRILALLLGPTVYAFAATLAAVIAGVAGGSAVGAWAAGRTKQPGAWLSLAFAGAALTASWTCSIAGTTIPRFVARQMATAPQVLDQFFQQGTLLTAALILPTALCLGAAFPLALALVRGTTESNARRFGVVYAINTVGAVAGSLAAGFVFIPLVGLQSTLRVVSGCLIAAALIVVMRVRLSRTARALGVSAAVLAGAVLAISPPWDRELLASGAYLYAPYVPKDLDLVTLLKAGTVLYYREGAASTVSVKRLTGTTTLAVDGKVDASNRSDMLTQKLIAHLPLLLHDNPSQVGIIGLGSGVTVGAALQHPIAGADVVEISPEVVEASRFFESENRRALDDPRTHLIVGDGRTHLLLADRQYDVIISEPSNPWIAGVAALFTREFFEAARARLAPGGIICQWAHTYNISDADLRSIVATFTAVFPDGTLWLVGDNDLLLVAATEPLEARLGNIARNWQRPGVADDLSRVAAVEPFSLLSLYAGGRRELARYGEGAALLTDDNMTLEFSGPRELHRSNADSNSANLSGLMTPEDAPVVIRDAQSAAGAAAWRNRAAMLARSDMHASAYDDYVRALTRDPADGPSLEGIVKEAVLTGRAQDALGWLRGFNENATLSPATLVAMSKLLAAHGMRADALDRAREAARVDPKDLKAAEQLASVLADAGDLAGLEEAVASLRQIAPEGGGTLFYAAVTAFLQEQPEQTIALGRQAMKADPSLAPVHDLVGAAHTKLGQLPEAREAFLTSLRFDPHDSTAYTNLGVVELAAGNREAARRYFAEALNLAPTSPAARAGLAQASE